MSVRHRIAHALLVLALPVADAVGGDADASVASRLLALHEAHATALDRSAFGEPLVLDSSEQRGQLQGDVLARVERPFGALQAALGRPQDWCVVLALLPHVRGCTASANTLQLRIGRRFDQPLEDTEPLTLAVAVRRTDDALRVRLAAPIGPLGTRDYRIGFDAVALGPATSFIRLQYGHRHGVGARLAAAAYFATSGRDKAGFSIDAGSGRPVGGLRGGIERNAMRLYLAIDAVLVGSEEAAGERKARALQRWLVAIARFPRQLGEDDPAAYRTLKLRQFDRGRSTAGAG